MQYIDKIYGATEIKETVLLDLIKSDAMQRLKGVSQHGITALLGITPPFSRFDHSIGTMILVRHLGASLEEQIAALLHDISHTAFSHVIDFVFNDHSEQSYHEEKKEEYVAGTDIPAILTLHDRSWQDFMDEEKFQLLEQASPALCADRLDYFLRDLEFLGLATENEVSAAINSLEVKDGKIVVNNHNVARWMGYTFIETDRTSWSNFREVGLYQLTAEAIKVAAKLGVISEVDLWGTDKVLWEKLCSAGQAEIKKFVGCITPGTRFIWDDDDPVFRVTTKVRSIDPPVLDGKSVIILSKLDSDFKQYRKKYLAEKQGHWPMGIVCAKGGK